jgi:Membrane-associated lipoprotein involved in thiamine biosynthesis
MNAELIPAPVTDPVTVPLHRTFRSMATDVTLCVVEPAAGADIALDRVEGIFRDVETSCTRFDPHSPLMRANAEPRRWHTVPPTLFAALEEAHAAHLETSGAFDPRVLRRLQEWGYDHTLPFKSGDVSVPGAQEASRDGDHRRPRRGWKPRFDPMPGAVKLGPDPVDLGGIGKGLAVRWAAEALSGSGSAFLVEAGGDLYAAGAGLEGDGWRVGVEDPRGNRDPVAVLRLQDLGCATSSIRVRHWKVGGREVHHIIDPRTGEPANLGLLSVTVVGPDPARAEVWSKALFLAGRGRVRQLADELDIAALLVDQDGVVGVSRAMRHHLVWQADRGF